MASDSSSNNRNSSNSMQPSHTLQYSPQHSSYAPQISSNPHQLQHQQPAPSSALFSRSELQAIDGFLESFSAPLTGHPSLTTAGAPSSSHQQQPYSSSTALYRPEYENPWRGPPTIASSTAPTLYNNQHSKYASYHPTAHHRPSSPSSASASSSSYPQTLGQATSANTNGLTAVRPPRISNSPFSSTSYPEESPNEREKRLKNQAHDLAGWLSWYNNTGQPSSMVEQHTTRSAHQHHHSVARTSGHSSTASTSNSEGLPTPSSRAPAYPSYMDFVATDASVHNVMRPSDMLLPKAQSNRTAMSPVYTQTQIPSYSEPSDVGHVATLPDSGPFKGKTKPSKGAAKKKVSSTTAAAREKKAPTPKAPAGKAAKSEISLSATAPSRKVGSSSAPLEAVAGPSNITSDPANANSAAGNKPALSDEQKRANHIASEQKRRHAIRAAYDALCTVVPSLRAAVKEYEDRLSKLHPTVRKAATGDEDGMDVDGTLQTVAGVLTGGIDVGGEKIDGRAGPRSEAVVLANSKSQSCLAVPFITY